MRTRVRLESGVRSAISVEYLCKDDVQLDENAAKKNLRPVIQEPLVSLREAFAGLGDWSADVIHAAMRSVDGERDMKFGKLVSRCELL